MKKTIVAIAAAIAVAAAIYFYIQRGKADRKGAESEGQAQSATKTERAKGKPISPGRVEGKVTSKSDGKPVAGATVLVHRTDGDQQDRSRSDSHTATTADDGTFAIDAVVAGSYRASATAKSLLPSSTDVTVSAGATAKVELSLDGGGNPVTGKVVDVTGGPIEGAAVRFTAADNIFGLDNDRSYAALTGADGTFALELENGRYASSASHPDYVRVHRFVEVDEGSRSVQFQLTPGSIIEGKVVQSGGEPVPYAQVLYQREEVQVGGGGRFGMSGPIGTVLADGKGLFRVDGLQSGTITLRAASPLGATTEPVQVSLAIGEPVTGVELVVSPGLAISGKVVDSESGKPIEGATVSAFGGEGLSFSADPTGKDGAFVMTGVVPGNYRLRADGDRLLPTVNTAEVTVADSDVSDVEVKVRTGVMVRGRVDPPTRAAVRMDFDKAGRMGMMSLVSDYSKEDGTFEVGPVRNGELHLVARGDNGTVGRAKVEIGAKDVDGVVIPMTAGGSIIGTVVDENGKPVTEVRVSARTTGKSRHSITINGVEMSSPSAVTSDTGEFAMRGLDPGTYRLEVVDTDGGRIGWARGKAPANVKLARGDEKRVKLEVEAKDGVIKGVARSPSGEAMADAWVTVSAARNMMAPRRPSDDDDDDDDIMETRSVMVVSSGPGGMGSGGHPPVLTDSQGKFEITGLRRGKYSLLGQATQKRARGYADDVETGSTVDLVLYPLTSVKGRVTLDGVPAKSFFVELDGKQSRSGKFENDNGEFEFERIDPGKHTIKATSDTGSGEVEIAAVAGEVAEVEIPLERLIKVTGRVLEDGKPLADVMFVTSPRRDDGRQEVSISIGGNGPPPRSGEDGRFEMSVKPGAYTLLGISMDKGGPVVIKPIDVVDTNLDLGDLAAGAVPMGGRPGGGGPPGDDDDPEPGK